MLKLLGFFFSNVWKYSSGSKDRNYSGIIKMSLIKRVNRNDYKESHISIGLLHAGFSELWDFLFPPVDVLTSQRNKACNHACFKVYFLFSVISSYA